MKNEFEYSRKEPAIQLKNKYTFQGISIVSISQYLKKHQTSFRAPIANSHYANYIDAFCYELDTQKWDSW